MKKYLLFIPVILILTGCATRLQQEQQQMNILLSGKEFYTISGENYTCKVHGPYKAEANYDYHDKSFKFSFKDSVSHKLLSWIGPASLSEIKTRQTIISSDQISSLLKPGNCMCAFHIADKKAQHYLAIEKSVFEKEFPIVKKAFEEKARSVKKAAEKKAKEKAKKKSENKQKAEKEATVKNNYVIKKYGKPYCEPFKAIEDSDSLDYHVIGGRYVEREKGCLFEKKFHIQQVLSDGMLVYNRIWINDWPYGHYEKNAGGPYFLVTNQNDKELVDGDSISGLFEYIGTYTYTAVTGAPKTVLKYKHVE